MNYTMSVSRKESLQMAGKEFKKGLRNAAKALKEAVVRPKRWQDCFTTRLVAQEKHPEIDWFTKTSWEDFNEINSFDTEAYLLRDNFMMDPIRGEGEPNARKKEETLGGVYSHTYTSFSGCDAVAVINGEVIGELNTIRKQVNGDMEGYIDLAAVKFD